jgi:hypothetical protein
LFSTVLDSFSFYFSLHHTEFKPCWIKTSAWYTLTDGFRSVMPAAALVDPLPFDHLARLLSLKSSYRLSPDRAG